MAYDEKLAQRIRTSLQRNGKVTEKKMFGGVCFLYQGNMCAGVWKDRLIARIGPEAYVRALRRHHVREFDVTGRPMKGWVMVEPEGVRTARQLDGWIERAREFTGTLPPR